MTNVITWAIIQVIYIIPCYNYTAAGDSFTLDVIVSTHRCVVYCLYTIIVSGGNWSEVRENFRRMNNNYIDPAFTPNA